MSTPQEFRRECEHAAKQLRRLPAELRRTLGRDTRDEVAAPLADRVRSRPSGAYGRVVAGTVRVRSQADPTIVVGGARRVASGGATGRDLAGGSQWGGGNRTVNVAATARARAHKRPATRQFVGKESPFVPRTIITSIDWAFTRWAAIVDRHITDLED